MASELSDRVREFKQQYAGVGSKDLDFSGKQTLQTLLTDLGYKPLLVFNGPGNSTPFLPLRRERKDRKMELFLFENAFERYDHGRISDCSYFKFEDMDTFLGFCRQYMDFRYAEKDVKFYQERLARVESSPIAPLVGMGLGGGAAYEILPYLQDGDWIRGGVALAGVVIGGIIGAAFKSYRCQSLARNAADCKKEVTQFREVLIKQYYPASRDKRALYLALEESK